MSRLFLPLSFVALNFSAIPRRARKPTRRPKLGNQSNSDVEEMIAKFRICFLVFSFVPKETRDIISRQQGDSSGSRKQDKIEIKDSIISTVETFSKVSNFGKCYIYEY